MGGQHSLLVSYSRGVKLIWLSGEQESREAIRESYSRLLSGSQQAGHNSTWSRQQVTDGLLSGEPVVGFCVVIDAVGLDPRFEFVC